jgi:BirA family biotin operon repressor/biotin-[acetyl-CoA-carboxylase] ligase
MNDLDANVVRRPLSEKPLSRLDDLEIFEQVDSTNSYLLQQVAPDPGRFRIALADHQTAGRGRHYRHWQSPPGTGLCLSLAYTFATMPNSLPNLTLALGVGVARALASLGITEISLKWPNDIVALDGKLGGMLAETRSNSDGGVTVVAGIGLNVDLREQLDFGVEHDWAHAAVDLKSISANPPSRDKLAGAIVEHLYATIVQFEELGFDSFVDEWRQQDWLLGRVITVDMPDRQITGVAAGVDSDGALLVDTKDGQRRVISGSIVMASLAGTDS